MDDPILAAVQKFMDAVEVRLSAHTTEIRSMLDQLETRASSLPTEGPPGKDGKDGRDGIDGKPGVDGVNGKDGTPGERGADGIATREEIETIVKASVIELQTRSLADAWVGVFQPGNAYKRGAIAQWDGTPWLALSDTTATPGLSPEWKLFAKKGKDASRR